MLAPTRGDWIECEMCTRQFRSHRAASQHMNALDHWRPRVPCETCSRTFASDSAANSHMRALGHYRNYCQPYDRRFNNENSLRMVYDAPFPNRGQLGYPRRRIPIHSYERAMLTISPSTSTPESIGPATSYAHSARPSLSRPAVFHTISRRALTRVHHA